MTNEQRMKELEQDLVDYIMGLWHMDKIHKLVNDKQTKG